MTRRHLIGLIPFTALGAVPLKEQETPQFSADIQHAVWLGMMDGGKFFAKFRIRTIEGLEKIVDANPYMRDGVLVVHPDVFMFMVFGDRLHRMDIGESLDHIPTFCGIPVYLSVKVGRGNEAVKDAAKVLRWNV
jgi:hypothetical protein